TLALALTGALFTGCSVIDDTVNGLVEEAIAGGSDSSHNDKLTVSKTSEGFLVTWTKTASDYGEVIFTDGTTGTRGNGYPLTSNTTGMFSLNCESVEETETGVRYDCAASNTSDNQSVSFVSDTAYQWLVSYGTEHEHGEVEAVTEYSNGLLTVE
ncbi:MAG: hypothetical protein U9Q90_07060, partial [Campylobacterota bacterium]|nr:hypothetical protein [Campylobacterota bacterium]